MGAGVAHVRRALLPLPLPDAAIRLPGGWVLDTRDMMLIDTAHEHAPDKAHAEAVREFRAIVIRAIADSVMATVKKETKLLTGE